MIKSKMINCRQNWRENSQDQVYPEICFEKHLSQKERVEAGEGDGDTECDQESCQDVFLCPRGRQAIKASLVTIFLNPLRCFSQNEIKNDIFHIVQIEKDWGYTGLDYPETAQQKIMDFALGLKLLQPPPYLKDFPVNEVRWSFKGHVGQPMVANGMFHTGGHHGGIIAF